MGPVPFQRPQGQGRRHRGGRGATPGGARRQGVPSFFKRLPWKRAQLYVEQGRYHLLNNASANPERRKKYLASDPIYSLQEAFYYRKSQFPQGPPVGTVADIDALRIGGMRGYNFKNLKFDTSKIQHCQQHVYARRARFLR